MEKCSVIIIILSHSHQAIPVLLHIPMELE